MTEQELNKLQGLVDSISPTNWELVRLILEANGETDGELLKSLFREMLIEYSWSIPTGWEYTNKQLLSDLSFQSMPGRKSSKFLFDNYRIQPHQVFFKETKVYERFTKDKESN